ncbi:MAG: sugar nucleotide-binding protein [Pseudomonadota bacterium]|nr:sugar nucleotide-binding protein [Pseudomonadota bacterium]
MTGSATGGPEIWGGVECTVNRVGNTWFNQLTRTGHAYREDDLDRVAALGIKTLRFPLLWELHQPTPRLPIDWPATDRRLARAKALGITPIAGLLHHGSGPAHTELLSAGFADGLANFANQVAHRYPWLEWYTPINEPLTTARFSGLYGLWYPHARSDGSFTRMLINQCRAIVLCMRAVRRVNPEAKLLQTEDLGKTYSTPHMKYQARFENQRRWLTWDLLCGRVDAGHPLYGYLLRTGISGPELGWFQENRCPPDLIGLNHYVTSDRFLDENAWKYPPAFHGANFREAYADVEAVRVLRRPRSTWDRVIREAARRYHSPLALTEVHIGCTPEEQLRWLHEAWDAARRAAARGYDVRAVTAWALFGNVDWNTLLTRGTDHYESGAFDVSFGKPRETAVAKLIRDLILGKDGLGGLGHVGWWHRPQRLLYAGDKTSPATRRASPRWRLRRPVLITGGTGVLGQAFAVACEGRGIECRSLSHSELNIDDPNAVAAAVSNCRPWAVVNAAAVSPRHLVSILSDAKVPLLTFSSAHVFDGQQSAPYRESSPIAPQTGLGRAHAAAEQVVMQAQPGALVIRLGRCFGTGLGSHDWLTVALDRLHAGKSCHAIRDVLESPTYVPDAINASLNLLIDGECGIWHLANRGSASEADLIERCAAPLKLSTELIERVPVQLAAACNLVLDTERGMPLPPLESAIQRFLEAVQPRYGITAERTRRTA